MTTKPHLISCNGRDGIKPRRGGLFIATNMHRLFFLFFGGAAFATTMLARISAPNHVLRAETLAHAAPPKNKKKGTIYVLPYKQATPTGLPERENRRQSFCKQSDEIWLS